MVIAHNIASLNTYKSLGIASSAANKSMEKLSAGYRINRAGDDAAGLSISEKMRSQIRGLNRASRNAQDGISMIQTAEGALNEEHSILQRMRELAVQSASDTNQMQDREALQNEMAQLTSEINRIGNTTEFNGMKLLNGEKESSFEGGTNATYSKGGKIEFVHGYQSTTLGNGLTLLGDGVTFDTTADGIDFSKLQNLAGANTVQVMKNSAGEFEVNINLIEGKDNTHTTDAGINSLVVDADKMVKNDDGSYSYNNHGISFNISKEVASSATNGDGVTFDLKEALGVGTSASDFVNVASVKMSNIDDYSGDMASKFTVKGFELSEDYKSRLDYDKLEIKLMVGVTPGTDPTQLEVKYLDGANTVVTDTISIETAADGSTVNNAFTYNANGVKFSLDINKIDVGKNGTLKIDLDEKLGTNIIEQGGTKTDRSAYFHVGANSNQTINMDFGDMRAAKLGIVGNGVGFSASTNVTDGVTGDLKESSLNIISRADANTSIEKIDNAIKLVSEERSKYGAIQNRLEYTINNLNTTAENMQAAESRIRDVDMASEMMELTKSNILQQAAQTMLSQANQKPQQALQLLQQ